jgi:hypothetical protein
MGMFLSDETAGFVSDSGKSLCGQDCAGLTQVKSEVGGLGFSWG